MNIIEDLIPRGAVNRLGTKNTCRYITIHETDNTRRGANAKSHAAYIKTIKNQTSWHYTVDDSTIYRHIPDNEKSYSTSNKIANENSIAIEICVNSDGNFSKACDNAAELCRALMARYNIPSANIKQHYNWSGKNCPRSLRKSGWAEFKDRIEEGSPMTKSESKAFDALIARVEKLEKNKNPTYATLLAVPSWGREVVERLTRNGILKGDTNGQLNITYDMLRLLVVLDRAGALK